MEMEKLARPCGQCCGTMPACAPLAVPYVPFQQNGEQKFGHKDALNHGTLFPCLDLPFRSKAAPSNAVQNALNELQALEFVLVELGLYLDTHPDDSEAFALFQQYSELEKAGREKYEAMHRPITRAGVARNSESFEGWTRDPWPWNYEGGDK